MERDCGVAILSKSPEYSACWKRPWLPFERFCKSVLWVGGSGSCCSRPTRRSPRRSRPRTLDLRAPADPRASSSRPRAPAPPPRGASASRSLSLSQRPRRERHKSTPCCVASGTFFSNLGIRPLWRRCGETARTRARCAKRCSRPRLADPATRPTRPRARAGSSSSCTTPRSRSPAHAASPSSSFSSLKRETSKAPLLFSMRKAYLTGAGARRARRSLKER